MTGVTKDFNSGIEIPFINIYLLQSKTGTSSDVDGHFRMQINKKDMADTLVFSAIGYQVLKVPVKEVLQQSSQTFLLKEDVLALEEVTVSAIPAVEIIRRAMKNRKNNYVIAPHKLSGTYRITDQEDGAYVRLLEAAVAIYDSDYFKKNSRVVDYLGLRQSKDFRTFRWKVNKLSARNADELLKPDLIKRPTRATHPNGFNKGFFYKLEKNTLLDDQKVYIISATKNPAYEWPNYNATFYVRASDFAILRVDRDYTISRPNWAKSSNITTQIESDRLILKYKEANGRLYLNYFLWNLKGTFVATKSNEKITNFERNEELSIHNVSLTDMDKSPKLWEGDIYKIDLSYDPKFWEDYPVSSTKLFQEVRKEFEKKQDLKEQFLSNDTKYSGYDPTKAYKVKELKEDFVLFRKSLEEAHPSLYRYTSASDFAKSFDSTYQTISKPLTEVEFYRMLTPLIAKVNCGHTEGMLSEDYYQFYEHRDFCFPLQTTYLNEKLWVSKDYFSKDTIPKGSYIRAINDIPIASIRKTIDEHLSSDGYIQTSKNLFFGRYFVDLYNIYYGQHDSFSIEFETPDGQLQLKELSAISFADQASQSEVYNPTNLLDSIRAGTALLQVRSFTDKQGQPFKKWIHDSFEKIDAENTKNLIIDLRNNTGGRDDYALFLYSFLTSNTFRYHKSLEAATDHYSFLNFTDQNHSLNALMKKIVQKDTAGRFMLNPTHPTLGIHKNNVPFFTGNLFVLTNGNTFSAAADFAAIVRQNKRGTFIGEETGGTAIGNTSNGQMILSLPNTGIRINIPLFKTTNAVNVLNNGRGVVPDHNVPYTLEDELGNKDSGLKSVLGLIDGFSND